MPLEYIPGADPVPHDVLQAEVGGSLGLPNQPCSVCSGIANEVGLEVYKCSDGSGPYYYSNATLYGGQITSSIIGQNVIANTNQPCNNNQQLGLTWHVTAILPALQNPNYNKCTDLEIWHRNCVSFPPTSCDFGTTSYCSQLANFGAPSILGNAQVFLQSMRTGYLQFGCQWFQDRITHWTNQLVNINAPIHRIQKQAKIDWANCMLNECCGQGGLVNIGCMDDGLQGNYYLNNQGTLASPQYGSVTPGTQALNYYAGATVDDGSCVYVPPVYGCKDPTATNYDPNADTDCGNNFVSQFNINYTNWQGFQPPGSFTPYGDTSCCTYLPTSPGIEYNFRFGKTGTPFLPSSAAGSFFEEGMFMPGGAYLSPGSKFGDSNNTTTNTLKVGLNPLSTQLIPNKTVLDPSVISAPGTNMSWGGAFVFFFHVQTNMADSISMAQQGLALPNEYHITIWDAQENLRGKWKYGLGTGSSTNSPAATCGAVTPCYSWWGFHFISHLAGDPQVIPQHGDFMKIEYWKEYPNDWNTWNVNKPGNTYGSLQYIVNNWLIYPGQAMTPYYQAVINAFSLPATPFSNSADLVDHANTGNNIRFNWMGQQGGQPIPFWKECIDSCTSTSHTNANGCREWFPQVPPLLVPPFGAYPLAPPVQQGGTLDCCDGIVMPMLGGSAAKLSSYELGGFCATNTVTTKSIYDKNENQTVEVTYEDMLGENDTFFNEEENDIQKVSTFIHHVTPDSTKNVFNISFKTNEGYYYSKSPSLNMNFPGRENYKIKVESETKNGNGYVIEKTFNVIYKNTGFDVLESDGHNIRFSNEITKEVDESIETQVKEITALQVDTSSIDSDGESRNISVVGTPGSTFSLTIKDKNGRNVLFYSNKITKILKTAISASNTLELSDAAGLEVGMILLNDQRRNVKITSISEPIKANVDAINETLTIYISISSFLTFSADTGITFVKETDITEVAIPDSGVYSFAQYFPPLEKFKRTLKTAASAAVSLTLDYTDDLENDMRITGTGVDGNNPTIGLIKLSTLPAVDPDGVTIKVSDAQTIDDETELTFEMPDNRFDITLYPLMAILGDGIPRYSSKDCDALPTYSIYQYIDPIVQIAPSSDLSNVTTDGTITLTGKANKGTVGTSGDITISMTATKSDGSLAKSRAPRFSSVDSESSDFSNTLNTVTKTVREDGCNDRDIVHLNNTSGIRVGMIVTGESIDNNKTITVKNITGVAVKLSEKQTIRKDDVLTFSSMFNMHIGSLTATLSANGGLATGICTITGTGKIESFGVDSFTSTFDFDNFLSIVG